jgi:glutathione S-transferase
MKPVKLYDMKAGMNPRRVRIFLAEKGITIPMIEVDMAGGENSKPAYLAKNPMGKMPVLEFDDGWTLAESIAICRYFETVQPNPRLFGATPIEQARIEMWNRRMENEIMRPAEQVFTNLSPFWTGKRHQVAAYGEYMRTVAAERMTWLDGELATRTFIAGETYTVADITAQCALLLGKNTGTPIPAGLVNLQRWFKAVTSRPTARA